MALQKTIINPYSALETTTYQWISLFQLRFDNQTFRMDTLDYASKTAYLSNSIPLSGTSFTLPKEGLPALDSQKRRLFKKPDNTYVLEEEKDNPDAATVVPTYPEILPMIQYIMTVVAPPGGLPEGTPIFGVLLAEMYKLLASRPEFEGCTVVDV